MRISVLVAHSPDFDDGFARQVIKLHCDVIRAFNLPKSGLWDGEIILPVKF